MEKSEKKILIVVAIILSVIVIAAATVVIVLRFSKDNRSFEPPAFDASAVVGTPQSVDENSAYGEMELPISNGRCVVAMAALPTCTENQLNLIFTADSENSVYVRVIVYTDEGDELGSSGLLRPGEYVPSVTLTHAVTSGNTLRVKILTYEPDTYYSLGSTGAVITVR